VSLLLRTWTLFTLGGQARGGVLELELEDVDKLSQSKDGPATLRAEWKHGKSVTAAYWDPRGRSIVSTSYDDALRSTSHKLLLGSTLNLSPAPLI
jgi:hypothetical protein